jgi:hypothetical protein
MIATSVKGNEYLEIYGFEQNSWPVV